MSTAYGLWRRVLVRLRPAHRHVSFSADVEGTLLALTDEFEVNDRSLHDLLACDNRGTADVPGFEALADRQAALVGLIGLIGLIVTIPAQDLAGLVARARCARLRPPEQGFDAALSFGALRLRLRRPAAPRRRCSVPHPSLSSLFGSFSRRRR